MTMEMKTATALIFSALLTLSLAACGGSSSSSSNSAAVSSAVAGTSETQSSGNPLCVRIDGTVYRDTGYVSSAPGCGNMDGEITSTVDGSEMPSEDNQSNFGTGYGYQLGSDGLILVALNDELEIFRDVHSTDASIPDQVASFIGQVERINEDTIRVKYVGMPENSICFSPGDGEYDTSASSVEGNVEKGDYVRVWYTGSVAETYPAQIDAYRIEKIDNYTPDSASST